MKRLTLLCSAIALLAATEACARDHPQSAADSAAVADSVRHADSLRADSVRVPDTAKPTASAVIKVGTIRVLAAGLAPTQLEAQTTATSPASSTSTDVEHRPHGKLWWAAWTLVALLIVGAIVAFLKRHGSFKPVGGVGDGL